MNTWIPLLQSLIWPLFLAFFLIWQREWVRDITEIIKIRLEKGAGLEIGSFKIHPVLEADEAPDTKEFLEKVEKEAPEKDRALPIDLAKDLFLVHNAEKTNSRDRQGRPYYDVRVQLASANPALLDEVSKVEYHLHQTFANPNRLVENRINNFELTLTAWGQFTIRADVYFIHSDQKVSLSRFLNF